MGKIRNFEKIKWEPFQIREGNICVSNHYINRDGEKIPMQSHLDIPRFSFFEIAKYQPNHYFGKLQEYLDDVWSISDGGTFLKKEQINIQLSFFTSIPETCYMLASWKNIDHDERVPDLQFVGSRPLELDAEEQILFMKLAKEGQKHIESVLDNFDEHN